MPVQTQCTVAEAVRLNDFACSLTLDVGEEMAGQIACGQFVHIKCGHSRLLRRPISICGDRLDVLGPLGHGFDVAAGSLLVVGGGIGAPPMLGCAKYAASRGSEVHAVLGFRDAEHKMLTEDFAECCRSLNVISDDGSTGRRGFVPELVEEFLESRVCEGCTACGACGLAPVIPAVLACGPKSMLRAVAEVCARYGAPCQVSLEERMGCGVGACLVCACKTSDGHRKHVCKDGPVFRAEEVDWND